MRSIGWKFARAAVVIALAGCSQLPGRAGLGKLGLPSPQATIAAAEKKTPANKPAPPHAVSSAGKAKAGPASLESDIARGRLAERSGQYDKARKAYEAALTKHPDDVELLHRLGIVADAQKKHAEAEQFFLRALDKKPRNAELLGDLGYCYYLQGKLDKAASALTNAVALDPKTPRHHNNLGLVLGHQKDYDGAFAQFSAAGSQADAYYNMAFVFAAQNLNDEAKGCFQEALAADPAHQRAKVALASFEEYERTPANVRDRDTDVADSGVRYVPYIEGTDTGHGDQHVQQASVAGNLPASRDVGRTTRTLQLQSRGLLNRHMQNQRDEAQSRGAESSAGSLIEVQPQ